MLVLTRTSSQTLGETSDPIEGKVIIYIVISNCKKVYSKYYASASILPFLENIYRYFIWYTLFRNVVPYLHEKKCCSFMNISTEVIYVA